MKSQQLNHSQNFKIEKIDELICLQRKKLCLVTGQISYVYYWNSKMHLFSIFVILLTTNLAFADLQVLEFSNNFLTVSRIATTDGIDYNVGLTICLRAKFQFWNWKIVFASDLVSISPVSFLGNKIYFIYIYILYEKLQKTVYL